MREITGTMVIVVALAVTCVGASAQQVEVRCGPAAAVITTTAQQQATVSLLQHKTIQPYTTEQRAGRPFIVYENGQAKALIPMDDYEREWRARGGGNMAADPTEPDPERLRDIEFDEFPMSQFVHCYGYTTPVRDQNGRGMCHAFASIALLESLAKRRLMQAGVPEHLAELDLSDEWMSWRAMKDKYERYGTRRLTDEGHFAYYDLEQVQSTAVPYEAWWPYDPESWPDVMTGAPPVPKYPAGDRFAAEGKCAWELWGHCERDKQPPQSVRDFRELLAPDGPLPRITCQKLQGISEDVDEALRVAKEWIAEGRPVPCSFVWPTLALANDTMSLYYVADDYPFAVRDVKVGDERALTADEVATWEDYYAGGHVVLLIGYGQTGTSAEGIWMLKNSHGLDAGDHGIVYITDSLLRLSFPYITIAGLSDRSKGDLDSFAETITR